MNDRRIIISTTYRDSSVLRAIVKYLDLDLNEGDLFGTDGYGSHLYFDTFRGDVPAIQEILDINGIPYKII